MPQGVIDMHLDASDIITKIAHKFQTKVHSQQIDSLKEAISLPGTSINISKPPRNCSHAVSHPDSLFKPIVHMRRPIHLAVEAVSKKISENYFMRPERPVHQTLRNLKTLTANLDVAS